MRAFALFCIFGLSTSCGLEEAGMEKSDLATQVEPLTSVTITDDCPGGGTFQLTASIDTEETPPKIDVDAEFEYTACVTEKYGTVDGTLTYERLLEETAPDQFSTDVKYNSNLDYGGTHLGGCSASFVFIDQAADPKELEASVVKSCPHPGVKLLEKLEKCKFKKDKKGKKKGKNKCKFKF